MAQSKLEKLSAILSKQITKGHINYCVPDVWNTWDYQGSLEYITKNQKEIGILAEYTHQNATKIILLQRKLEEAITKEKYERAAILNDELTKILNPDP